VKTDSEVLEIKVLPAYVKGNAWYSCNDLHNVFIIDNYDNISRNIALGFRIIKLTKP
jgi:hypothetical protein